MFDFLFKNGSEEQSYIDIITKNFAKAAISEMADEKARGMIARAIAKSEFVVKEASGRKKNNVYWMLNIQPNENETGTDFWISAIKKLLKENECKICTIAGKMYIVDSCTETNYVMKSNEYRNIVIRSGKNTCKIDKEITSKDMLHLRLYDEKKKAFHDKIKENYNNLFSAISGMNEISNSIKLVRASKVAI